MKLNKANGSIGEKVKEKFNIVLKKILVSKLSQLLIEF
jgi:hypothetical protein